AGKGPTILPYHEAGSLDACSRLLSFDNTCGTRRAVLRQQGFPACGSAPGRCVSARLLFRWPFAVAAATTGFSNVRVLNLLPRCPARAQTEMNGCTWLKEASALGHCRPEDVAWLSSRSDSDLDMLIRIKETVIERAKFVGCEEWGVKFSLKMLRAIDLVLRECLKEGLINASVMSKLAASAICPDELDVSGAECHEDVNSLIEKEVNDWEYSSLRQEKKLESSSKGDSPARKKPKIETR
ncbi:hypothetical protein EJ110_NYTH49297, partial [Nymphaea thermarum]